MSFRITWKTHLLCYISSILIIICIYKFIKQTILYTLLYSIPNYSALKVYFLFLIYIVLLTGVVTLVHEFIHGIAYKIFGGTVKYGFKLIYAYTMETSGISLSKTQFLIVLLSPLVTISLLAFVFSSIIGCQILCMGFIINFAGSSGDIVMALYLCKIEKNHRIIDRKYGFDIVKTNDYIS